MNIYFSGIGGSGLCPLAHLSLDCGYQVCGSDAQISSNTQELTVRGINITIGQSMEEIQKTYQKTPFDWIICTSALPQDHPHRVFADQNNIKITKRHELINTIVKDKNLKMIAVAGTHGKTTTTGMLVWIFKQLNIPISYLIGTNISYGQSGEYAQDSKYFVYECDEFDRNMLNFEPYLAIVPSLDYDHPDTYKTEKDYCESFIQFFSQCQSVISWQVVENYLNIVFEQYNLSFSRMLDGKEIYFLQDNEPNNQEYFLTTKWITLDGILKRRNGILCVIAIMNFLKDLKLDVDNIFAELNSFPGTQRRFEKLAPNLYSDYGHHPTEIIATLQMATEYLFQNQKLILVYQPHQNLRQHDIDIQNGYKNCFLGMDKVYWLPTHLSRENELPILTPKKLIKLSNHDTDPIFEASKMTKKLITTIKNHLKNGDLVLVMGAGSIDDWARENLV